MRSAAAHVDFVYAPWRTPAFVGIGEGLGCDASYGGDTVLWGSSACKTTFYQPKNTSMSRLG